jgi:cytochrome b561
LAATALAAPMALAALVAGVVVGVALAWWGLRLTQFEKTGEGYFYTPNAHIGIALSVLLVARLGYRFFQMATLVGPDAARATHEFGRSPLTMVIIGMLAAYYASYAVGILRWRASAAQ